MDTLTKMQAYASMYKYLEALYERTGSDELGVLLGGMSLLADGTTADPAAWVEWESAVRLVVEEMPDLRLHLRREQSD